MRAAVALIGVATACWSTAGATQAQPGSETLGNGLNRRVLDLNDGVQIQRAGSQIDAGYFRIRITPVGLANIRCPKVAFKNRANDQQWQKPDQQLYKIIFKQNVIWSVTARVAVGARGGAEAVQEIPLILIKNPDEKDCQISALADENGNPVDLSQASFLVPVASSNPVYSSAIQLILSHAYTVEPDKQRVEAAWTGLQTAAKVIAAPFGAVIGALSGEGTATLTSKLSKRAQLSVPYNFPAETDSARAPAHFVYLGFEAGEPNASAPSGGVRIAGDYQATMFRPGRFYDRTAPLTPGEILGVSPIRVIVGGKVEDRSVRDQLTQTVWDQLATAPNRDVFDSACAIAQSELRKIGLSDVDKDAFLWAVASGNAALADKLRSLKCLNGDVQTANLAKVGIVLPDPSPPPGLRPKKDDMHAAMESLVVMMKSGIVTGDLGRRFADKINVTLVDDALAALPGAPAGLARDRAAVLAFLTANFTRGGCYVPRDDETNLPLRPLTPLAGNARAGAMIIEAKGGAQYVASLGFDPAPSGDVPKVSTLSIQSRGQFADEVVRELAKGNSEICPKL